MVIMAPNRRRANEGLSEDKKKNSSGNKESDEYKQRRERNNLAVKKSRSKTKMKTQETLERVNKLRAENENLEAKIKLLSKELSFLKDLFLAHAGNVHGQSIPNIDPSLFADDPSCTTSEETIVTENTGQEYTVKLIVKNE